MVWVASRLKVISRMVDIGVPPFLVASSVIAIMAQRLVRIICPKCKEPDQPPAHELKAAGLTSDRTAGATFMRGRGCTHCSHTGYRGRLGIFEMLLVDDAVRRKIQSTATAAEINAAARAGGMASLRDDGVAKVRAGVTTVDEVLRVTMRATA